MGVELPVLRVLLKNVAPAFELPRGVTARAVLRSPHDRTTLPGHTTEIPNDVSCVLEIQNVPGPEAMTYATKIMSAVWIASDCCLRAVRFDFPNGSTMDAEDVVSILGHATTTLTLDTIQWIDQHFDAIQPFLIADSYSRVANALRLHGAAIETFNSDLALLGCVGAIESLFSIAPQELSFRLSLQLAKFLGDNERTQREYFDRARELYKVRSKIAHGDKLTQNEEAAAIQVVERWAPEAETLARQCLKRVFDKNLATTFNSRNLHEVLLIELLFQPNLDAAVGRLAKLPRSAGA